jgi:hypothetical protein
MPASIPQGATTPEGIGRQTTGSQDRAGEAATPESRKVVGSGILARGSRRPPHMRRNRGGRRRRRHIATVEARSQPGRDRLLQGLGRILADSSSSRKVRRPNRGRSRLAQPLHHPLLRSCPAGRRGDLHPALLPRVHLRARCPPLYWSMPEVTTSQEMDEWTTIRSPQPPKPKLIPLAPLSHCIPEFIGCT